MLRKTTLLLAIVLVYFSSCKKDVTNVTASDLLQTDKLSAVQTDALDTSLGWYGHYGGPDAYLTDSFPPSYFIHGGVAQLPNITNNEQIFSYTNLKIPVAHPFNGDSITFEMDIKNPKDGYHFGWDVTLDMKGENYVEGTYPKLALLDFVSDPQYQYYTQFHVGYAIHNGLPQMVHDFEDFATVRLVMKNHRASLFLNATPIYSFPYKKSDEVGRVNTIELGGKGYPACTRVKIYNSYTGRVILSENFNTDGQSTIVYH